MSELTNPTDAAPLLERIAVDQYKGLGKKTVEEIVLLLEADRLKRREMDANSREISELRDFIEWLIKSVL